MLTTIRISEGIQNVHISYLEIIIILIYELNNSKKFIYNVRFLLAGLKKERYLIIQLYNIQIFDKTDQNYRNK